MDKRGQFYIIIVLIAAIAMYGVSSDVNTLEEPKLFEDFSDLSNNYIKESSGIVNYALFNNQNATDLLPNFTVKFLTYAKQKNPTVSLIYFYSNGSVVEVRNYLNESTTIVIAENTTEELFGASQPSVSEMSIEVGGIDFIHDFPTDIQNFGEGFYTASAPPQKIDFSISGIIHRFDLSTGPSINIFLRASDEQVEQVFQGDGSEPFEPF